MAQKESQHREVVDELTAQLSQVQRQHDELTALSRDQVCLVISISLASFDLLVLEGPQYVD
jgi:hypothetical protein